MVFQGMVNMRNKITSTAAISFVLCASAAFAADKKEPRPEIFQKLVDCRAVPDSAQRLACYDAQVSLLDAAETREEVVVVDRAQIKKARKSLFGLTLPSLSMFGGDKDDGTEEGFSFIESKIAAIKTTPDGKYAFKLEDGARWTQTEYQSMRTPKVGDTIRIRKAALGSFMANINERPAIRVKREN